MTERFLFFLFMAILLTVMLHAGGIELVLVFGIAKILSDIYKLEVKIDEQKTRSKADKNPL